MKKPNYQQAKFLLSVANLHQLPPDEGIEVGIVGRSNSGKSSVLNQLTHNKSLARVSKTPGRTQHINLFGLDETRRIADLPGYGYAKVPPAMKLHWQKTLNEYLQTRECMKGLILVMDIRHPLKEIDQNILDWCHHVNLPVHILLNKCDKLSKTAMTKTLGQVSQSISKDNTLQLFSALNGTGIDALKTQLDTWFCG